MRAPRVPLQIAHTTIRQDAEGRYCLNDCHKASGGEKKDGPSYWLATDTAKKLAEKLAEEGYTGNPVDPVHVLNDGPNGARGTYVAKELVYAYAMWISPAFHLTVIRAFDAMVVRVRWLPSGNSQSGNLTFGGKLPKQESLLWRKSAASPRTPSSPFATPRKP